jgi:hypothetical protein
MTGFGGHEASSRIILLGALNAIRSSEFMLHCKKFKFLFRIESPQTI